jgi:SAM-dependent methyltransferase
MATGGDVPPAPDPAAGRDGLSRYQAIAARYGGFAYPWSSTLGAHDGETAFSALVNEHLRADLDVLEAGCGHGSDALLFAPRVRSYLAYDYVESFVRTARERAAAAGLSHARFVVADSSPKRGGRTPAEDASLDLLLSRRGPSNFILDAGRVGRPGARMIQLCYMDTPLPAWNGELSPELRLAAEPASMPGTVHDYLARAGLALESSWTFDVPELFADPSELLLRLSWAREPLADPERALAEVRQLFAARADARGLALRHRRFLWTAVLA